LKPYRDYDLKRNEDAVVNMFNNLYNFFDDLGIKQESSFKLFNSKYGLIFKQQFVNLLKKMGCTMTTYDLDIVFKYMDKEKRTYIYEGEYYQALKSINQNPKLKLLSNAQFNLTKMQKQVNILT